MDILFVTPSDKPSLSQEVNGTMLLATKLLQEGYRSDILRFFQIASYGTDYPTFIRDITLQILAKEPQCVSFYTLWPSFHIMLRIARSIKEAAPHIPIVMGGPLVSLIAEELMAAIPWVDFVCCGEGENTVVPFFSALLRNGSFDEIPGLCRRGNSQIIRNSQPIPLCDLNSLPHWDFRLLSADPRLEKGITAADYYMPIDVGRGCPYNCTFCCTSRFWLRNYRLKSPEKILNEIRHLHDNFGIRSFLFSHDAFTSNKKLVSDVCDQIIASGLDISWACTTRADCVDEELILKMKASGLTQIQLGVETGSARMQKLIHKNLNLEEVKQLVVFLLKQKITVSLFFMYGFPEETEQDLRDTIDLVFSYINMGVKNIAMSYCTFSPATQMTADHFDDLVFDPAAIVSSHKIFGLTEELAIIKEYKCLFPYFYHLNTPLRNDFVDLNQLVGAYRLLPKIGQILRQLYGHDDFRLYRDFIRNNADHFVRKSFSTIEDARKLSYDLLCNTIQDFSHPCSEQLRGLMEFLYDSYRIAAAEEDCVCTKTYTFSYLDYSMKKPYHRYTNGQSEITIEKRNGKIKTKVLDIR